ncbi:MAG: hypothetical protein R3F43_21665 [bacterium]
MDLAPPGCGWPTSICWPSPRPGRLFSFPKSKALRDLTPGERARVLDSSDARDLEDRKNFNNNMVLRADLHDTVLATKDRMVRTPRWKLIHIPGKTHPSTACMQADPGQTRDLSGRVFAVMPPAHREKLTPTGGRWRGAALTGGAGRTRGRTRGRHARSIESIERRALQGFVPAGP